jgi:4-hydroxybenzoate polyprenyltransferase
MKSRLSKVADVFFLVRPPLLCASAGFFFLGAISGSRYVTGTYGVSLMLPAMPNLATFLLVGAFAFVVNQIFDVRSDTLNRKNFVLPSGAVSRVEAVVLAAAMCTAIAILCRGRDAAFVALALAGLGLGLAYSVPPARLKARPVADLLANVAGFGWIGFAMGWIAYSDLGAEALRRSLPYSLAMGSIFLNTCIPDEQGDRVVGDRTTCVAFGRRRVSYAALSLMSGAVLSAILVGEPIGAVAAISSIPGLIAVAVRPAASYSIVASQMAACVLVFLAGICAPILLGIAAVTYLVSRLYYRTRFGLVYPRLGGADLPDPVGCRPSQEERT